MSGPDSLTGPPFTPARVSPGIPIVTASLRGTELSQGADHFTQYRKAKTFLNSRSFLYKNDKILSFPSLWCRMLMGIFLQVFSFQYKTQLAVSRDSWWKGGQGGTQGLYLVFKAGYCKGLRSMGSRLGFKPSFMPPHSHPSLSQGDTRFSKVLITASSAPTHPAAPTTPISPCLFPSPENLLLLVSS